MKKNTQDFENELISVIVPIYNVEKYLQRCINSIQSQTYRNLEIILVDDGSPDHCGKICDQYAQEDQRIKVIHQKNKGLSGARNAGIDVARGAYLSFIDSDDFVQEDFIELLYDALIKNEVDISQCFVQYVEQEKDFVKKENKYTMIKDDHEMMKELYGNQHLEYTVVWNKLYKREIFNGIRFPEGKIHEDEFVIHFIYGSIKKAAVISAELYGYFVDSSSITRRKYSLKRQDIIQALEERLIYFNEKNEKDLGMLTGERLADILIYHSYCTRRILGDKRKCKELYQKFKELYLKQNKFTNSNFIRKMYLCMYYYVPGIFNIFFSVYQKSKRG